MSAFLTLLLGLVVVIGITVGTGYFVAQEFAYMSVDRSRLEARSKAGDAVATRTLSVTRRTSFMLSGAQLGITVTGLLVGNFAEPLIGESLGTLLGGIGIPSGLGLAVGAITALVVSTFVQMLFGELFPKNFAIARPEPVARWLSLSTTIYLKLFGWLIRIFDASSNALLKALKIEPVHDVEHSATARDLEHIVAESRDTGDLPEELSTLLDRILDFPTRTAGHAMIPRSKVATVRADSTVAEVRASMSVEHSRYPVLEADDSIEGVVHLRDVLATDLPDDAPVSTLSRDALVVPESQMLPDTMGELRSSKNQLACVIDEYGSFTGVVTIEDLAEELVGEITDEHDETGVTEPAQDEHGVWTVAGDVHLDEVERAIGHDLPEGDYETIAGLAISVHGALPDPGDVLEVDLPIDHGHLAVHDEPVQRYLTIVVREIDNHVPSVVTLEIGERQPDDANPVLAESESEPSR
ncbi:hemolysin family protein [Rhodococcoides trifolii]|uniref:hemolysin family protein n=1 Tax=Rhodococcoides trifolii TaxID=908250 RepID=UPI001666437F